MTILTTSPSHTPTQVAVVADSIADIAEEVRRFAASYDYVLTTGGIGPTHDDVTLEAVGMAFQEESKINSEILNFLFGVDGDDLTSPWRKMAIVRPTERTCTWTAALARQAKAAVSSLLVS
jgi:molybdopterin-biosynthesis enzyme MoeA-like protein